jgi:hypothetical protein
VRSKTSRLQAEQGEWDDRDPVPPAIGLGSGGDDDGVDEVAAELFGQPVEVADVGVIDSCGELHLDREDGAPALDDEVDLAAAMLGA